MEKILQRFLHRFDSRWKFLTTLGSSSKVLDLGCGKGDYGVILKGLHPTMELHGVDLLPRSNVPDFYSYKIVDLDNGVLPFPDDCFDAILFSHVIEHLRAPLQLGKEINRIMKSHALIYVETPNWTSTLIPSFGFRRAQHNPFNFYDDPTHIKPWSKHGLYEFLFERCGLEVNKVATRRNWLRVLLDIPIILFGLTTGNRKHVVASIWNLTGWCIYGIAKKR